MALHLLPDDLGHLPAEVGDQDYLLRLLSHLARRDDRVNRHEASFIEALAEKMGRAGWELPEHEPPLDVSEIARIHTCWPTADGKLWLAGLLRRLAAADGLVHKDENLFLEDLAARLFSSSDRGRHDIPRERLSEEERELVAAAAQAASHSNTEAWHRKTHKVVGAAIGVERDGAHHIFRGVNFELSQPTGSRCAEQVALGAALVHFGGALRFGDIRRIAVVAGPNVPNPLPNPLPPCGVCCEMILKLDENERQIQLYMLTSADADRVIRIAFSEYYPPRLP